MLKYAPDLFSAISSAVKPFGCLDCFLYQMFALITSIPNKKIVEVSWWICNNDVDWLLSVSIIYCQRSFCFLKYSCVSWNTAYMRFVTVTLLFSCLGEDWESLLIFIVLSWLINKAKTEKKGKEIIVSFCDVLIKKNQSAEFEGC